MSAKWGVLGCAGIAAKTCSGMVEASNAVVAAVGSRYKAKAEKFISDNTLGAQAKAYGSYQEVLDDPEVQVVYVPLPTSMKREWVLKAAAAKKHVLCEKPLAATGSHDEACAAAGVQFMDNTMFMHHDRTVGMQEVLADTALLGEARHVNSTFTIPFGNDPEWAGSNIRMKGDSEPLGCFGDLGWYNIRLTEVAFNYADPEAVSCQFLQETDEGVPVYGIATMKYPGGRIGRFECSFVHALRQWGEIVGTEAWMDFPDFVVTNEKSQASFTVSKSTIGDRAITLPREVLLEKKFGDCVQHTRLIEKMSEIVVSGKLDEFWPKVSLQTQTILGACFTSARQGGAWVDPAKE